MRTDLSKFDNNWYKPGANLPVRVLWHLANHLIFQSGLSPIWFRRMLLRAFGAKVGGGVIIKPGVNVKYPWKLRMGDHVWIGENVWIDNLDQIDIASHVCVSQGAMLLCGNHDYTLSSFDLIVKPIRLEDGCWIGARAVVCPGVTVRNHAVLAAGSIATKDLEEFSIYQGNPAQKIRDRRIRS